MALKGNAVIGQSGGPTSVINQSLVGVVQEISKNPNIDQLLGARHGVRGIINEQFIPLKSVPNDLLERIAQTPAAALGSTRDKPDAAYCDKIFQSFKKNNVRYFFYIGGNDSADTARIVNDLAAKEGYELRTYHIPKTIDNDLRVHDHTPGYGSAARYVASAMLGDNFDNASLPGIKIDVIMGRHAGFLTAASVLARRHPEDGPHLIYVPEAPLSEDKFLADVDAVYSNAAAASSPSPKARARPMERRGPRRTRRESGSRRPPAQHPARRHRRPGRRPLQPHHQETHPRRRQKTPRPRRHLRLSPALRRRLRERSRRPGSPPRRPSRSHPRKRAKEGTAGTSVAMRPKNLAANTKSKHSSPRSTPSRAETKHMDPSYIKERRTILPMHSKPTLRR